MTLEVALATAVSAEAVVIGVLWQKLWYLQRAYERVLRELAHLNNRER